jgi:hypothetical protein
MVTCARCGADYDDADQDVTWSHAYNEWTCTYVTDCDDRLFEQRQGEGHPDGF